MSLSVNPQIGFGAYTPGSGSGTVTSITAGAGLTGGTITTSGTVALDLAHVNAFTAQQSVTPVALTPGTTVSWNMNTAPNATLAPVQNFTLSNPSNIAAGGSGMLTITQDGTGSRVITWGSAYKFAGGTKFVLSTAANAVDTIAWYSPDGTNVQMSGLAAFS